jgi:hypothetical protein
MGGIEGQAAFIGLAIDLIDHGTHCDLTHDSASPVGGHQNEKTRRSGFFLQRG